MDELLIGHLPDSHELFQIYDTLYFESRLQPCTILEWSDRMTSCAGICYLKQDIIIIRLSRKLLQLRPFSDTINTLLHEMIHAYLFLTAPRSTYIDRGGHGPAFQHMADLINTRSGSAITTFHSFTDEVREYRKHVWRCEGRCREWPPYFGWVRRAMNRPPQPADRWFAEHEARCGGRFVKVEGPDLVKPQERAEESMECPVCLKKFACNKYKLEFHVEQCMQGLEMAAGSTAEAGRKVYIIDE
jgi:predicted SprT family Zn-dependent metalloprotease